MENEIIEERKMNVNEINVPDYVDYISEWKEFEYPLGHLILDKTICGCGFTEYCLNNQFPLILCSPRKGLLVNKEEQHNSDKGKEEGLREVYYFRNDYESNVNYDGNKTKRDINVDIQKMPFGDGIVTSLTKTQAILEQENLEELSKQEKKDYISPIKDQLRRYVESHTITEENPFKIIVTYDSLHHVLDVLNEYYPSNAYNVVVDEFQSIFMDASFKATVELDFVEDLKGCKNVLYLSATPMLEKYLVQLDYFKNLPFYKLIWSDNKIEKVRSELRIVRSINKEVAKIVDNYRNGRYPDKVLSNGEIKYSKEVVFFVNSINSICDIIKSCNLTPEETNIICADTSKNISKLRKVGHKIGNIPTKGESHKMVSLCTRTTYLGADFYSTSAFTVVCSDCNIQTMTVDISLDLPQILGRQRLRENVFRNEVLILYKAETKNGAVINEKKLVNDEKVAKKEEKTLKLLDEYDRMTEEGKLLCADKWARDKDLYSKDYLGVSKRTGQAAFNYLVKIADQRAYDVTRKEYIDEITIKKGITSIGNAEIEIVEGNIEVELQEAYRYLVEEFDKDNNFSRRIKLLCSICSQYPDFFEAYSKSPLPYIIPRNYQNYINAIGIEKIKALNYQESEILTFIDSREKLKTLSISDLFNSGDKITTKQIKKILGDFYTSNSILKTPKASDLENYFIMKPIKLKNSDGKWENGFEIISIKSKN